MRIIAGMLKGKRLKSFQGRTIRPTSDRIRESIFNILSRRIKESVVLDLFAGTGALGIEALSRGAKHALFIEKDKGAAAVLHGNLQSCRLVDRSETIQWDIEKNLNCIRLQTPKFTLVFMDPPYSKGAVKQALANLHGASAVEAGACVVVEHSIQEAIPENSQEYILQDRRRYGKTLVSFLEYMV